MAFYGVFRNSDLAFVDLAFFDIMGFYDLAFFPFLIWLFMANFSSYCSGFFEYGLL